MSTADLGWRVARRPGPRSGGAALVDERIGDVRSAGRRGRRTHDARRHRQRTPAMAGGSRRVRRRSAGGRSPKGGRGTSLRIRAGQKDAIRPRRCPYLVQRHANRDRWRRQRRSLCRCRQANQVPDPRCDIHCRVSMRMLVGRRPHARRPLAPVVARRGVMVVVMIALVIAPLSIRVLARQVLVHMPVRQRERRGRQAPEHCETERDQAEQRGPEHARMYDASPDSTSSAGDRPVPRYQRPPPAAYLAPPAPTTPRPAPCRQSRCTHR